MGRTNEARSKFEHQVGHVVGPSFSGDLEIFGKLSSFTIGAELVTRDRPSLQKLCRCWFSLIFFMSNNSSKSASIYSMRSKLNNVEKVTPALHHDSAMVVLMPPGIRYDFLVPQSRSIS